VGLFNHGEREGIMTILRLSAVRWLAIAGLVVTMTQGACGQTTGQPGAPKRLSDYGLPGLETKVNLQSIEPMDVVQLIEFLAHRGGLNNIIVGRGVSGAATKLKFDDVTVADALEVVLSVNQLAYDIRSGILTIITDAEYEALNGRSFYDQKETRVATLRYADATRVANMLGPIKSAAGIVVADPATGSLILVDTPAKIAEMAF
jgi:type II secretory pathway component GspD/PulD (secretin)